MTTTNTTPTAAEQQIIDLMEQGFVTAFALVKETGKTPAAIRSILNRMRHRGLIEGSLQAPALVAPAAPAPVEASVHVMRDKARWVVRTRTAGADVFTADSLRAGAMAKAEHEARKLGLPGYTLANRNGRLVTYTFDGDKVRKTVA